MIDLNSIIGKEISVDAWFQHLIKHDWKYDLEESDLFYTLSKTFWKEGIKVSIVLENSCCIPPNNESSPIKMICLEKFDLTQYPKRDIYSVYKEERKNQSNDFETVEEYIAYLNEQYPYYIHHADLNTGIGHNDNDLLQPIDVSYLPQSVTIELTSDLKHLM